MCWARYQWHSQLSVLSRPSARSPDGLPNLFLVSAAVPICSFRGHCCARWSVCRVSYEVVFCPTCSVSWLLTFCLSVAEQQLEVYVQTPETEKHFHFQLGALAFRLGSGSTILAAILLVAQTWRCTLPTMRTSRKHNVKFSTTETVFRDGESRQ